MIQNTILNQLNEKGFVVSKIRGVSMWPFFNQKNTQVYIKSALNYNKNDCILFLRGDGSLIMHRILYLKKDFFLVCGDNQSQLEKVYCSQIKGKMTEYYINGHTRRPIGIKYHVYVRWIRITRPIRIIRDLLKRIIKKIINKK
jgi:hypothetical protein